MSTFAKSTFNAIAYAASRPSYPPALYESILAYAALPSRPGIVLLDLGCGPGIATLNPLFVEKFDKLIGLDPSTKMIAAAQLAQSSSPIKKEIEFRVGRAEDLSFLERGEVDFVTAGQAAHWFEVGKVYRELERVLKPGGSFAFWGYGDLFVPENPAASKLLFEFSHIKLKEYWQEPGRSIVDALLLPLPFPTSNGFDAASFKRVFHTVENNSILLEKDWNLKEIIDYIGTWSSVHSYTLKHGGNVVESLEKELLGAGIGEERVRVSWPVGMMMGKKQGAL